MFIKPTTVFEIKKIISELHGNKSLGHDSLPAKIVKAVSVYTPCLKKTVHFCFCHNVIKFPQILINFGSYMAKWLKLYAIDTFSTKPDPRHYTYLVKRGCSKFLPNTGFITIRLLRSGVKVKRAYCRGNFLA